VAGDFTPFETKMRKEGLPQLAIRTFRHYYEQLVAGERGTLPGCELEPVGSLPELASLAGVRERGLAELERAVVIKLNGGLGTSMGMTRAKSLLPVKGELSFLDIIARQVLALRGEAGARVPLLLMDSFRTRDDSLAVLARYPELGAGLPLDFLQHKVPRIRAADLAPAEWPEQPEYEWCPPGHGDLYTALLTSGTLATLQQAGRRWAFVSNADNLGAVLDPEILGWFAASGAPFAMEVCERTAAHRKGGHLARLADGRLVLRELAQCPEDERESFQDVSLFQHFNTNNLWLDLEALASALEEREGILGLPLIVNEKSIDPEAPASDRVIQLETAMGAAVSVFPGAVALQVPRSRFAPVKTSADLLAVRSDAFVLDAAERVVPAPERGDAPLLIELDLQHYRTVPELDARFPHGPPSLVGCRRLTVKGDVRFGRDVACSGAVELMAPPGETLHVPDSARLQGGNVL
jgi:UTP--glucose-1-phosphate uridylyltransferase